MMREAEILSPSDKIVGVMLSSRLVALIDPAELRFFPGSIMHGQG